MRQGAGWRRGAMSTPPAPRPPILGEITEAGAGPAPAGGSAGRGPRWKALPAAEREEIAAEAAAFMENAEAHRDAEEGSSALYNVVGHKADLMLLHLRPAADDLAALERDFARTRLSDFTTSPYSY